MAPWPANWKACARRCAEPGRTTLPELSEKDEGFDSLSSPAEGDLTPTFKSCLRKTRVLTATSEPFLLHLTFELLQKLNRPAPYRVFLPFSHAKALLHDVFVEEILFTIY